LRHANHTGSAAKSNAALEDKNLYRLEDFLLQKEAIPVNQGIHVLVDVKSALN